MRGETSAKILAVGLENHHQTPAEQVDIHLADAGPTEARHDLGPDLLMMLPIRLERCFVSGEVDGEHGARYHPCPGGTISHFPAQSQKPADKFTFTLPLKCGPAPRNWCRMAPPSRQLRRGLAGAFGGGA